MCEMIPDTPGAGRFLFWAAQATLADLHTKLRSVIESAVRFYESGGVTAVRFYESGGVSAARFYESGGVSTVRIYVSGGVSVGL